MIDVEKFVQNMLKHFTWVSFLLSFLKMRMLIISVLWCELSQFILGSFLAGTLLMTPERRRAIWAIYGE